MKKIISLLLIIAMLFSISACKRSDTDDDVAVAVGENDKAESSPEEQENTEDDVPASPQNQDDTQAEENKTESEKVIAKFEEYCANFNYYKIVLTSSDKGTGIEELKDIMEEALADDEDYESDEE